MTVELMNHDIAEFIETKEDAAMFLQAAFEEAPDDPSFIQHMLGQIGRGLGMSALAEELGVTRASLYKSLHSKQFTNCSVIAEERLPSLT